ncbi:MAG: hypothetical protein K1W00_09995 [Lachnospiraceae bacterium]
MLKIFLIILAVLVVILLVLVILGKRLQKKQESQQASIDAAAQTMNFFIIDKKMMKLTEAGLPKVVLEQTPKLMRRAKLPILKVKIGPKVMSLICDQKVFETLAPKQEVKATVSGIYVTGAKRIRGPIVETDPKKRKAAEKQAKKEAKQKAKEAKK